MKDTQQQHRRQAQRINLVTALADAILGVIKIIVGILAASGALIADGIHSLADLITDLMVVIATHFGRRAPDKDHPYGHGRIETMASLGLGLLLVVVAGIMAWDSLQSLFSSARDMSIGFWAIAITVLALGIKELIFHWTIRAARVQRSPLLEASAWHSRSDSLSSLIVLVGLIGSLCGLDWLDPIAAIAVSLLIAKIGWDTLWHASRELIDTTLSDEEMAAIRQSAMGTPELKSLHDLRARRIGANIALDVHFCVECDLSVSEAHEIGNVVTARIRQEQDDIHDVTFHIDVEDDHLLPHKVRSTLPLRGQINTLLNQYWQGLPCWEQHMRMVLHYGEHTVQGQRHIDIELFIPEDCPLDAQQLATAQTRLGDVDWFGHLSVWRQANAQPSC